MPVVSNVCVLLLTKCMWRSSLPFSNLKLYAFLTLTQRLWINPRVGSSNESDTLVVYIVHVCIPSGLEEKDLGYSWNQIGTWPSLHVNFTKSRMSWPKSVNWVLVFIRFLCEGGIALIILNDTGWPSLLCLVPVYGKVVVACINELAKH